MRGCMLVLALVMTGWAWGQSDSMDDTDTRAVTKANFLYHFAASNEWPEEVKSGDFHLTIIGNDRLYEELVDKYAMKMVGAQPLHVNGYSDVSQMPADEFHHLVYCDEGGAELRNLADAVRDTPTVLVSDAPDGLQQGAVINFVALNNRIRYEINADDAAKKGVLIGIKTMRWAIKQTP